MDTHRMQTIAGGLLLLISFAAGAVPLSFEFEGTINSASGVFAGPSSIVTGSFHYDSALVDDTLGNNFFDRFESNLPGNAAFDFAIEVSANGVSRTTANNQNDSSLGLASHHRILLRDNLINGDNFEFFALRRDLANLDDSAAILLFDASGEALTPGFNNLTGQVPISFDLNLFNTALGSYGSYAQTPGGTIELEGTVDFSITSLSGGIAIPLPTTLWLIAIGLLAMVFQRDNAAHLQDREPMPQ